MTRDMPPRPDELEVSIIGPGRGECVVLHVGDNDWCIVDSCVARNTREPVAIEYLRSLKNGAVNRIKLIVATHWHDDHIQGLAAIVRDTPGAEFGCSAALQQQNFATLLELASETIQGGSGVDEFREIFDALIARGEAHGVPRHLVSPNFALANRRLLSLMGGTRSFPVAVTALSPSDGTFRAALTEFAKWLPKPGEPQRRIPNQSPNKTSTVLWMVAGTRRVLLGADLQHTSHEGEGWKAVLSSHQDVNRAAIFKIPHHGSQNADCPDVWSQLLEENPLSVVTPFTSGIGLPKLADLRRLSSRTHRLYCTSQGPGQPPRRDSAVERVARTTVRSRRVLEGLPGHVRIRWSTRDAEALPTIETFNGAYKYSEPSVDNRH